VVDELLLLGGVPVNTRFTIWVRMKCIAL
jgi:hypothetical protein